jgi:hypothetical protein
MLIITDLLLLRELRPVLPRNKKAATRRRRAASRKASTAAMAVAKITKTIVVMVLTTTTITAATMVVAVVVTVAVAAVVDVDEVADAAVIIASSTPSLPLAMATLPLLSLCTTRRSKGLSLSLLLHSRPSNLPSLHLLRPLCHLTPPLLRVL